MMKFEKGKKNINDFKSKAIKGWKRFGTFANATALAILVGYAGQNVIQELRAGDKDISTWLLTVATILVGLTAAAIYIKFFTEDN